MNEFSKDIEKTGWWDADIQLTMYNEDPDYIKEFLEKEVSSSCRDRVANAIENGESFSISNLESDSSTVYFVKNNILEEYNTSSLGYDINYELVVESLTLDGEDIDWDDLSDESQKNIVDYIILDTTCGQVFETIDMEYTIDVSGIAVCSYDENYLEGEICINDQNGNLETCSFEYNMESEELSFHKYSNPGWMTGSSYETNLPDMIEDNLEDIDYAVMDEISNFIDEMNQDKDLPSLEDKLEVAETKQSEIPAIGPAPKYPAIGPAKKNEDLEM